MLNRIRRIFNNKKTSTASIMNRIETPHPQSNNIEEKTSPKNNATEGTFTNFEDVKTLHLNADQMIPDQDKPVQQVINEKSNKISSPHEELWLRIDSMQVEDGIKEAIKNNIAELIRVTAALGIDFTNIKQPLNHFIYAIEQYTQPNQNNEQSLIDARTALQVVIVYPGDIQKTSNPQAIDNVIEKLHELVNSTAEIFLRDDEPVIIHHHRPK